jgi:RNA recognition motif-containing protein
MTVNE